MTRRHFEALARALANARPRPGRQSTDSWNQWEIDVAAVAHVLSDANPRFDRTRFVDACASYPHADTGRNVG